jgi:phage terminase large subunit GpA-like protein
MRKPIMISKIDVTIGGREFKNGLELMRLDTDHWKSWVHERIRWGKDLAGAWFLPADATEDYCLQIVSEARVKKPSGRVQWVQRSRENHFLDCESMMAALASSMNLFKLTASHRRPAVPAVKKQQDPLPDDDKAENETPPPAVQARKPQPRGRGWLNRRESIWK